MRPTRSRAIELRNGFAKANRRSTTTVSRVVKKASRANRDPVARTSAQSSVVLTIFRNVCRRRSKARAAQMVRVPKRTSIARGNWLTTSIHCGVVWMKTHGATATVNSSKVISEANKPSRDNRAREVRKVNRARRASKASADNRGNRDLKEVSSKEVNRPAAHKTVASQTVTGSAAGSIASDQWAVIGATTVNFPPRFANGCAKPRTCGGNGARPDWAPDVSMKSLKSSGVLLMERWTVMRQRRHT